MGSYTNALLSQKWFEDLKVPPGTVVEPGKLEYKAVTLPIRHREAQFIYCFWCVRFQPI